jgi:hypothetical protein
MNTERTNGAGAETHVQPKIHVSRSSDDRLSGDLRWLGGNVIARASDVHGVNLYIARAYRDASLKIGYAAPKAARTCRQLMREHALKARGHTPEQLKKVATSHE